MTACHTPDEAAPGPRPGLGDPREAHPREYLHQPCGTVTRMPAWAQTTYLADPCFYGDDTICATCGPIPQATCTWVETGESLSDYMARLADEKSMPYHMVRMLTPLLLGLALAMLSQGGYFDGLRDPGVPKPAGADNWAIVIGLVLGYFVGPYLRWPLCRLGLI